MSNDKHIESRRAVNLIKKDLSRFDLDLKGHFVLTELASNEYIYNALIPLLANAEKTFFWTKDSKFGSAQSIQDQFLELVEELEVNQNFEIRKNERPRSDVSKSSIITNNGHIRPIDSALISSASNCVVPLMFEKWELRKADLDIEACTKKGVKVAGTNEDHPDVDVFGNVGHIFLKQILESGIIPRKKKIWIYSNDNFGKVCAELLSTLENEVTLSDNLKNFTQSSNHYDILILTKYNENRELIGNGGIIPVERLQGKDGVTVIHLYGLIDYDYAAQNGVDLYPKMDGKNQVMSRTLSYLGIESTLRLQIAGYKVAELMHREITTSLVQPVNY